MKRLVINSRGEICPERIDVAYQDKTRLVFDFSLLMPTVDSYVVEGDARVASDSKSGSKITVNLSESQACRVYDLVVTATGGGESRAATVQVRSHDRRRGWNSFHDGYCCGGCWL